MIWRCLALASALLSSPLLAAAASAQPPDPAFLRHVFPPELVMQHQHEVGLTPEQREAITTAIHETQGAVLEIQWQLQDGQRALMDLLTPDRVDADAALARASRMLDLEQEVKKAHLGLLIRIKNTLTPEQQRRLEALRRDAAAQPEKRP